MPIFEYRCTKCETKFEVLHKSSQSGEEVTCPECNSKDNKKLLSSFSASMNGRSSFSAADVPSCPNGGSCGCSSGMCGLD